VAPSSFATEGAASALPVVASSVPPSAVETKSLDPASPWGSFPRMALHPAPVITRLANKVQGVRFTTPLSASRPPQAQNHGQDPRRL